VATRMPGCDDVVTENYNGHLVPQRNPRAMAAAILDLLQDPARARSMGQRSIELVRREFDLNVVTDRYADLYRRLLSTAKPSDHQTVPWPDGRQRRATSLQSGNAS
jgi:glycosyltransferase involved in cell wall biosynthesis